MEEKRKTIGSSREKTFFWICIGNEQSIGSSDFLRIEAVWKSAAKFCTCVRSAPQSFYIRHCLFRGRTKKTLSVLKKNIYFAMVSGIASSYRVLPTESFRRLSPQFYTCYTGSVFPPYRLSYDQKFSGAVHRSSGCLNVSCNGEPVRECHKRWCAPVSGELCLVWRYRHSRMAKEPKWPNLMLSVGSCMRGRLARKGRC